MNKLSYGNYNPSISDIAFSATNGYTDPSGELETRKQLSYPLKEVKDFVNKTVSTNGEGDPIQLVVDSGKLKYRTEPEGGLTPVTGDIPSGGSSGQVLKKNSDTNYDVAWGSVYSIPSGGSSNQVLKKNSSTNYDVSWKDDTVSVLTTAPAEAWTGDGVKIVYLTSDPATKYSGYIYLIKE